MPGERQRAIFDFAGIERRNKNDLIRSISYPTALGRYRTLYLIHIARPNEHEGDRCCRGESDQRIEPSRSPHLSFGCRLNYPRRLDDLLSSGWVIREVGLYSSELVTLEPAFEECGNLVRRERVVLNHSVCAAMLCYRLHARIERTDLRRFARS